MHKRLQKMVWQTKGKTTQQVEIVLPAGVPHALRSDFNGLKSSPQFFSSSPKPVKHFQFAKLSL
jgi:hypothetical protein